ncbi:hypothetical protein U9M48_035225 [Paspalum notatum var. saurae]|uniref:Uncharacterized protein n=1 Tax=Paspalum notatum var. saurae TaxID=547442 RepID=A0AAQ3UBR1_PASNO
MQAQHMETTKPSADAGSKQQPIDEDAGVGTSASHGAAAPAARRTASRPGRKGLELGAPRQKKSGDKDKPISHPLSDSFSSPFDSVLSCKGSINWRWGGEGHTQSVFFSECREFHLVGNELMHLKKKLHKIE